MDSKVDEMLIEQHSSSEVGGGIPSSRRLLVWAQSDIWGLQEISAPWRLTAWVALTVCFGIVLLLGLGY